MSSEEYDKIITNYIRNRSKSVSETNQRLSRLVDQLMDGQHIDAKEILYALEKGYLVSCHKKMNEQLLKRYGFSGGRHFSYPSMPVASQLSLTFVFIIGTIFNVDMKIIDNAIVDSYDEYSAILPALMDMGYTKTPYEIEELYAIMEYIAKNEL